MKRKTGYWPLFKTKENQTSSSTSTVKKVASESKKNLTKENDCTHESSEPQPTPTYRPLQQAIERVKGQRHEFDKQSGQNNSNHVKKDSYEYNASSFSLTLHTETKNDLLFDADF